MTAEDRNRRAKWGHDIPRSWISDFNMTHSAGRSPQESQQQEEERLIAAVRAKAIHHRIEDHAAAQLAAAQRSIEQAPAIRRRIKSRAAQRAAAQRSIEQTLVIGAASVVFLVGAVVGAVATWQQLMPPAETPQWQR
jgi:hypothetical protein